MSNIGIEIVEVNAAPFNTRSWKEFADLINGPWHKGAPTFIQTGKKRLEAKAELDHRQFKGLVQFKLDFDRSLAAKLMPIAANGALTLPRPGGPSRSSARAARERSSSF
jgi:hypothetical protein